MTIIEALEIAYQACVDNWARAMDKAQTNPAYQEDVEMYMAQCDAIMVLMLKN